MNTTQKYHDLVDSHAHLDFNNFDRDREEVLQRAKNQGLKLIVNIGFDLASSKESIKLAAQYPFVYAAVGIHPHDAVNALSGYLGELEEMTHHPKVVALGEMGLDFYRDRSLRPVQREVFRQQLRLAGKIDLPVIIHDRDAHEEVLKILEEEGLPARGGVMHCFSGDLGLARKLVRLGLYISIAGPVTYPRNHKLSEVAAAVPLERLLIETDAPFLTPSPLRGKRNEPAYVTFVAEKVAALRGISVESLGRACLENARKLFSIE
ncbi:MAG: TatD family deoxyribonuclease [Dethiobacter sp.]|jgi:TatD DNase family protein|nr:MAG: TatD family deoxyribonuclease [Dethiobacter sp.]